MSDLFFPAIKLFIDTPAEPFKHARAGLAGYLVLGFRLRPLQGFRLDCSEGDVLLRLSTRHGLYSKLLVLLFPLRL